jgi:hypothetical protein
MNAPFRHSSYCKKRTAEIAEELRNFVEVAVGMTLWTDNISHLSDLKPIRLGPGQSIEYMLYQ